MDGDNIDPPGKKGKPQPLNNKSDFGSGSSILGYEGMVLNKAEMLIRYGSKGASISNLRHVSKTLKLTTNAGQVLGGAGMFLTAYEDYSSNNLGWGTAVKVGIGGVLIFASAPVSLSYAVLDIGVGLYTGTTITDRVGNYVNDKMR